MNREPTAIDCWITGCPWWENEPNEPISETERNDVRVAHMFSQHSVTEMSAEVERRITLMAEDRHLTLQERQDRSRVVRVLRAAINAVQEHPLPDDPM